MGKKVTKDMVPDDFNLALAIVDGIPVVLFGINCLIIGSYFKNMFFIIGALMCFISALGKVLWKVIVALKKINIWFLFVQMRIFMPIGFCLMLVSVIFNIRNINFSLVFSSIMSFPVCLWFVLGLVGMILMGIYAVKLDNGDIKVNWLEQLTNSFSQLCYLIGLLLLK